MLPTTMIAIALVLALGAVGHAATDLEKQIKQYEKITKSGRKVFCVCKANGLVGFLNFFVSGTSVKVVCRIPTYTPEGNRVGSSLCSDDPDFYEIVGP